MNEEVKEKMINTVKIIQLMDTEITETEILDILKSNYDQTIKEKENRIALLNNKIYILEQKISKYEKLESEIKDIISKI